MSRALGHLCACAVGTPHEYILPGEDSTAGLCRSGIMHTLIGHLLIPPKMSPPSPPTKSGRVRSGASCATPHTYVHNGLHYDNFWRGVSYQLGARRSNTMCMIRLPQVLHTSSTQYQDQCGATRHIMDSIHRGTSEHARYSILGLTIHLRHSTSQEFDPISQKSHLRRSVLGHRIIKFNHLNGKELRWSPHGPDHACQKLYAPNVLDASPGSHGYTSLRPS